MPKHMTTTTVIVIRLPTVVEVVHGRDSRVVVAHPTTVLREKANLVPMVTISVASRVTAEWSFLSVPIRDHLYHPGALIAKVS